MRMDMTRFQKYTVFGAAIFGMATLILGTVLLFTFPMSANLTSGFQTPIIAFEFAKTEADLAFLSGNTEISRLNRTQMDAGHAWDMLFPFAYGGFIGLMLLRNTNGGRRFVWSSVLIAGSIVLFDINENLTLLQITDVLETSGSAEALLPALHLATWLKWGAIGVSITAIACAFAATKKYYSATLSMITALSVAVCWASDSKPEIAETMSMIIFLYFVAFTLRMGHEAWLIGTRA